MLPDPPDPSKSGPKSGSRSFGSANGVWIASVTASHSATREKSEVQAKRPSLTASASRGSRSGSSPLSGLSPRFSISILYPDEGESRWKPSTRSIPGAWAKRTAAGIPT